MSTQFSIYYNSPENQEYLRQIIEASGDGEVSGKPTIWPICLPRR